MISTWPEGLWKDRTTSTPWHCGHWLCYILGGTFSSFVWEIFAKCSRIYKSKPHFVLKLWFTRSHCARHIPLRLSQVFSDLWKHILEIFLSHCNKFLSSFFANLGGIKIPSEIVTVEKPILGTVEVCITTYIWFVLLCVFFRYFYILKIEVQVAFISLKWKKINLCHQMSLISTPRKV